MPRSTAEIAELCTSPPDIWTARPSLHVGISSKLRDGLLQALRDALQGCDSEVALPAFDRRVVGAMHVDGVRERVLAVAH